MKSKSNRVTQKPSNSQTFEDGDADDQQLGTSQAQKGDGRKPAQSGKRGSSTTRLRGNR